MKKIALSVLLLIGLATTSVAQEYNYDAFRLTVGVNGGMSAFTVSGDNVNGTVKPGLGYGVDLGLSCIFSKHVGIHTGLGFSAANSQYSYGDITVSTTVHSTYTIDYESAIRDAKYDFQSYALTVPFQVAFVYNKWYANAGLKIRVPVKVNSDFSVASTESSATVRETGVIVTPSDPMARSLGCVSTDGNVYSNAGNMRESWHALVAVDGGFRFVSKPTFAWTLGLYAEYALNNQEIKGDGIKMTANSDGTVSKSVHPIAIEKLGYFAFGLKLQCEFGIKAK